MSYIVFNAEPTFSCLGGGAMLPSLELWPINPITKVPMMPLIALDNSFFNIQELNSDDWAVTIFIAVDYDVEAKQFNSSFSKHFALNDTESYLAYDCAFSKVILHPKGEKELIHPEINYPLFPKTYLGRRAETKEEFQERIESNIGEGPQVSMVYSIEAYLQEFIRSKQSETDILQINQNDLDEISPQHKGLFAGGLGYLIWSRNLKKFQEIKEVGKFFIQTR